MGDTSSGGTIVIDRDICMGAGMCILYAPQTFTHDDDTKAALIQPAGDPIESVRAAIDACPMGALSLVITERGE